MNSVSATLIPRWIPAFDTSWFNSYCSAELLCLAKFFNTLNFDPGIAQYRHKTANKLCDKVAGAVLV